MSNASRQTMIDAVTGEFRRLYGGEPDGLFFAPGRANLIGEHIDYNGGHVLPCALTRGTYAAVRKRADQNFRFYSLNFPEEGPGTDQSWTSYMTGEMQVFAKAGMSMDTGMDVVIGGDIPAGAGLSSSASLEVLTGTILKELYGFSVSGEDIALYGQEAEQKYVGVECGIMDQFACAMGREGYAIDLDTAAVTFEYVPIPTDGISLILTDTNKKHDLRTSEYNRRRQECEEALRQLNEAALKQLNAAAARERDPEPHNPGHDPEPHSPGHDPEPHTPGHDPEPIPCLCALSPERFEELSNGIDDPVLRRRAAHAVYENERVRLAAEALRGGDPETMGRLMNESHQSLRDNYEVSCFELDVLAEAAQAIPGVLGSRMMGGGFGGCTISLVRDEALESFKKIVAEEYRRETGIDCTVHACRSGGGPVRIR